MADVISTQGFSKPSPSPISPAMSKMLGRFYQSGLDGSDDEEDSSHQEALTQPASSELQDPAGSRVEVWELDATKRVLDDLHEQQRRESELSASARAAVLMSSPSRDATVEDLRQELRLVRAAQKEETEMLQRRVKALERQVGEAHQGEARVLQELIRAEKSNTALLQELTESQYGIRLKAEGARKITALSTELEGMERRNQLLLQEMELSERANSTLSAMVEQHQQEIAQLTKEKQQHLLEQQHWEAQLLEAMRNSPALVDGKQPADELAKLREAVQMHELDKLRWMQRMLDEHQNPKPDEPQQVTAAESADPPDPPPLWHLARYRVAPTLHDRLNI